MSELYKRLGAHDVREVGDVGVGATVRVVDGRWSGATGTVRGTRRDASGSTSLVYASVRLDGGGDVVLSVSYLRLAEAEQP